MTDSDLDLLIKLDRKIYPSSNAPSKKKYNIFYKNNPEFGIVFENKNKISGVCSFIPLNKKGFFDFINGKIIEDEINDSHIFDLKKDNELFLYIIHIENLSKQKEFFKKVLNVLKDIIEKLKEKNSKLEVSGFSALCVTNQGVCLFYNKLNFIENKTMSKEYIFEKNKKRYIFEINSNKDFYKLINNGYFFVSRSKLLVLLKENPSIIWNYLK